LPCIESVIRAIAPLSVAGAIPGDPEPSRYTEQVAAPLPGGCVGAHVGMCAMSVSASMPMTPCAPATAARK
jgi:hypothetical protein